MIPHREVRLIDENGNVLGVFSAREALRMAKERGLDLFIIVQPDSIPPVWKIMDYTNGRQKHSDDSGLAK